MENNSSKTKFTETTILGVLTLGFFIFTYVKVMNVKTDNASLSYLPLILIAVRILVTIYVVNIAKKLKLNQFQWGVAGFAFPGVTLIFLGFKEAKD